MLDHLIACTHCPKYLDYGAGIWDCSVYTDLSWVNRRGGCPMFPERDMTGSPSLRKIRAGQQKQKHEDRKYHSKNDGKRKYKFNL
jgi:hypothetical protein